MACLNLCIISAQVMLADKSQCWSNPNGIQWQTMEIRTEERMVVVVHLPDPVVDRVQVVDVEGRVRPMVCRELGGEQLHPRVVADERQPPTGGHELVDQVVLRDGSRREAGADVDERREAALPQSTNEKAAPTAGM